VQGAPRVHAVMPLELLPQLIPLWLEAWQRQQSDSRLTSWRASHRRSAGLRFTSRLAAVIRRWWTG
jgi:hypothetical protein